jgi:signal transduction histidine kinase
VSKKTFKEDNILKDSEKLQEKTQFVKFEIEDTGLGIPEDKINSIFSLFEYEFMTLNTIN